MTAEEQPPLDIYLLAEMPKDKHGFFFQVQRLMGPYILTDYRQVNAAQIRELLKKGHIELGNPRTYVVRPSGMAWLERKHMLIDPVTTRVTYDHVNGQRVDKVMPGETLADACELKPIPTRPPAVTPETMRRVSDGTAIAVAPTGECDVSGPTTVTS